MFNTLRKSYRYREYAPIDSFTVSELREFCKILNQYCSDMIGYRKTKGLPTYSVRKDNTLTYYGQYYPTEHKIYVYYNNVGNLKMFVRTFIHEYTHSIQNLSYYANRLNKFGYKEHPDEVQAREMELQIGRAHV